MTPTAKTSDNESPKKALLSTFASRHGSIHRINLSQSLFEISGRTRIYVRYSRLHDGNRAFYGLRYEDLKELEGRPSLICFLWDAQTEPLMVPFAEFEHVFSEIRPAPDGQYKAQVYVRAEGTELYIARAGRFNVDAYVGWAHVESIMANQDLLIPPLDHWKVQTLIASIGSTKGFDVWIPQNNRGLLDWTIAKQFQCCEYLPPPLLQIQAVSEEIDVIWLQRGSPQINAMFEVEHSTPIYSGLLRFNDVHLTAPHLVNRFTVVANAERRERFVRQLSRPTFQVSGLAERCSFMHYDDVFRWHTRIAS